MDTVQQLLTEVDRDINDLKDKLTDLERVRSWLARKSTAYPQDNGQPNPPDSQSIPQSANRMKYGDGAEIVLREIGTPLPTNVLVDEMVKRGLAFEKSDRKTLVNTVYSTISRNKRFVRVGPGTWELKERTEYQGDTRE